MLQGEFGILDGGRLFYLKLTYKLQHLGLHKVHADGALFSYVVDGKLHGVVTTNVDDLIMAGDELFDVEVVDKLQEEFKFSKVELDSFNHCVCSIASVGDGSIELNQNEYIDKLEYIMRLVAHTHIQYISNSHPEIVDSQIGNLIFDPIQG